MPYITGARRISRYTPAFTIVALCNSAEEGVGATMAPSSQREKGNCALLVSAAKASKITGATTNLPSHRIRLCRSVIPKRTPAQKMAAANPSPPSRFIHRARKLFCTASLVRV